MNSRIHTTPQLTEEGGHSRAEVTLFRGRGGREGRRGGKGGVCER